MIRTVIESPFGRRPDGTPCTPAEIERNTRYVRRCVADSLRRGEAPFASHAIYPLVLDDATPAERRMGMEAGFAWGYTAERCAVYTDYGETEGMREGIARAEARGLVPERRSIGAEPETIDPRHPDYERHNGDWHEWSTDTTSRASDGQIIAGEKPHRMFVRVDDSGLISVTEGQVTSDRPEGREVTGKSTELLTVSGGLAAWLIGALQKAYAVSRE